jgi:hypothetical protein
MHDDLAEKLRGYITEWLARSALRIRDEMCVAAITIRVEQPQGDDDGTLYLDCTIDETVTTDRTGGRITGQRFDRIPAPRSAERSVKCSHLGCGSSCSLDALTMARWQYFDGAGWVCAEHVSKYIAVTR